MSPQLIKELCESPGKLFKYAEEQAAKYPTPAFAQQRHSNKRKASSDLDSFRKCKIAKRYSYDLYSMKEKDALDKDVLTAHLVNDLSSCNSECIELNLARLCALCRLSQPKIPENEDKMETNEPAEEFTVSKVVQVEYSDGPDPQPLFEVKWDTGETTDEPIEFIWDCIAFQKFVKNFVHTWKSEMERLWKELVTTVITESLEPKLNDSEAIQQCKCFDYNKFLAQFFVLVRMRHEGNYETEYPDDFKRMYYILVSDLKYWTYYIRRLNQIHKMKEFEDHINKVDQSKFKMHVENEVDLDMPPMNEFTYTNDVIPRDGIEIIKEPPMGCNCAETGQCSDKSDCCHKLWSEYAQFAYTSRGKRRVNQGAPIYECTKACKCSDDCPNRVVQNGRKQTLSVFKTKDRGWGVRTEKSIADGQYVCEYVGEIISYEEAERRGKKYDAVGLTYLFDLDFNGKDNPYTVDAAKFGNVSRFINHSCNPNLGVWPVWTDCLDPNLHKLCLFTLRKIEKYEELTFDYVNSTKSEPIQTDGDDIDEKLHKVLNNDNLLTESLVENDNFGISSSSTMTANKLESQDEVVLKNGMNDELLVQQECDVITHSQPITEPMNEAEMPNDIKKEGFECKCGAKNCRKIIFC